MPTNSYDLIVVGDDTPGLIAAALCARRGMRVLWARTSPRPARYRVGPYELPCEPLVFPGLQSPAARRVIEELHLQHPLKRRLRESEPAFQLAGPDIRLDVGADEVELERELTRELGDGASALAAMERAETLGVLTDPLFAQDIAFPPTGFWERREVGRAAARIGEEAERFEEEVRAAEDPRARALMTLPAIAGGRAPEDALSGQARARALELWRRGAPRVVGDWEGFRELFAEKFRTHGGEERRVTPGELVFGWGGRAAALHLADGEELGAQHILAALPIGELAPLLSKRPPKRLRQLAEEAEPAGYRYTLNLVVSEAGIPEGMGRLAFAVSDFEAPLTGANALALYVGEADARARAVVSAQAVAPAAPGGGTPEVEFASLRREMQEAIERVMPFLSRHILLAHSPHDPRQAAADAPPSPGGDSSSAPRDSSGEASDLPAPIPPTPLWRTPAAEAGGLGLRSLPYQLGIKQLTLACSQSLPGLGLEGALVAGFSAAKLACAGAGKKKEKARGDLVAGAS